MKFISALIFAALLTVSVSAVNKDNEDKKDKKEKKEKKEKEEKEGYGLVAAIEGSSADHLPIPDGYDIANKTETFIGDDLFQDLVTSCRRGVSKDDWHYSRNFWGDQDVNTMSPECGPAVARAELIIKKLYDTSNLDNHRIFSGLFTNSPTRPSLTRELSKIANLLVKTNSTVFGNSLERSPGLLKDLVSLQDGMNTIKVTGTGQKKSIKDAGKLSAAAVKKLSNDIRAETANNITKDLTTYMTRLVADRTAVQMAADREIRNTVNTSLWDIVNQEVEYTNEYTEGMMNEATRYNDFQSVVNDALANSKMDTNEITSQVSLVNRTAPRFKKEWNAHQLAMTKVVLTLMIKNLFTDVLDSASSDIQNSIGTISFNLADQIVTSKNEFYANTTDYATDVSNQLNGLAGQVFGPDKDFVDSTDSSARASLTANIKQIVASLNTLGLGVSRNTINALGQAKALVGMIKAARDQVAKDTATILSDAKNKNVPNLRTSFASTQSSTKKDFDGKAVLVAKSTTDSISSKVSLAKSKLQQVMESISSNAGNSASDQSVAGAASADQAAVGATAAELAAARAKTAGDRASAGLSTVTAVFGAGLKDAMNTVSDISRSNAGKLSKVQAQAAAAQQSMVDNSYDKLSAAAAEASGASRQLGSSYSGVALAGASLTDSMNSDAQDLYFRINSQQARAHAAVTSANDLATNAGADSSSLLAMMAGFENQAPEMVSAAIKRISAIGTGIGAAGKSAQTGVSTKVGSEAMTMLGDLTGYLSSHTTNGLSKDLLASRAGMSKDGNNLMADANSVPGSVASQSAAAEALMKARANRAMTQSVAALSAAAGDSSASLSSLMQFDADLVDQKRRQVLAGSKSVIDASLDATKYVADAGSNFNNASAQYISDSQALGSAGAVNVSNVLSALGDTLSDTTMLADRVISVSGGKVVNATSGLKTAVANDAAVAVSQMVAKLAEAQTAATAAAGSLDPSAIETTASQLNTYIDSLKTSFEVQRKAFNKSAQQYAVRRIAAITGLSESVISQKASLLAGFANADASEDSVASKTTSTLQSLLRAVEKVKGQSGDDGSMARVSQMINSIGAGTNSFSASLTNQMRSSFSAYGDSASNSAASVGTKMGGLATGAASGANALGTDLANAIKLVAQSETAATAAANGGQTDVYTIAGMLKNFDQASKAKIANMIQAVQSGNMTMGQAMAAARGLQQTDITSVYDVVQSLSGYITQHEAMVNGFMSSLSASQDAIKTAVTAAITDHEGMQGDIMSDVANNTDQLTHMVKNLLEVSPLTQTTPLEDSQANMLKSVVALEDRIGSVVYGTTTPAPSGLSGLWFNAQTGQTEGESLAEISSQDSVPDVSFPDALNNLNTIIAQATGNVTTASGSFKSEVETEMRAASNLIQQIVDTVKTAVHI